MCGKEDDRGRKGPKALLISKQGTSSFDFCSMQKSKGNSVQVGVSPEVHSSLGGSVEIVAQIGTSTLAKVSSM